MYVLLIITGLALLISFVVNREKTLKALKITARRFINILPAFLIMLVLVSVVLFLIPDEVISDYLVGNNKLYRSSLRFPFWFYHINAWLYCLSIKRYLTAKRSFVYGRSRIYHHFDDGRCGHLSRRKRVFRDKSNRNEKHN